MKYSKFISVSVGAKTPRKILNLLLTVLKAPKHTALQAGGLAAQGLCFDTIID